MKLTLMGPDDSGHWFLCDEHGNSWRLVERWSDLASAAELLGWKPVGTIDNLARNALDFLMENIGEDFTVPQHVADYFLEMQNE